VSGLVAPFQVHHEIKSEKKGNRRMKQLEFVTSQARSDGNKSLRRGRESRQKATADLEEIIS